MSALAEQLPPRPTTPRGVEPVLRRGLACEWVYRFRTRWKDPVSGRRLVAEFDGVDDVVTFRAHLRVSRARGDVASIARGDITLDRFVELDYWRRFARHNLAPNTIASYRSVYRRHIGPTVGEMQLRRFDAPTAGELRDELLDADVGAPTVRRVLVILQGVFTWAIARGAVGSNPIRDVLKPTVTRQLAIAAPGPAQIEALRRELDPASAALVSLIGYEGLRPSEALALEERHLMRATLLVEQRLIDGAILVGLKTSKRKERENRSPDLYEAVRADVEAHLAQLPGRRRGSRRLLFTQPNGQPWTTADYRHWREHVFAPAVERAGIDLARPYNLRHGCASLLLHARRPLSEISEHMGHTVATLSEYYSHLILDLRDQDPVPVEQQIAAARRTGAAR
jgi:integrase